MTVSGVSAGCPAEYRRVDGGTMFRHKPPVASGAPQADAFSNRSCELVAVRWLPSGLWWQAARRAQPTCGRVCAANVFASA